MSLNFNTQKRMVSVLIQRINSIFKDAIEKEIEFKMILNRIKAEVYESEYWRIIPRYEKSYIWGFTDCYFRIIENDYIVWFHYHPNLGLIKSKEVPNNEWYLIDSKKSGFFWIKNRNPYNLNTNDLEIKSN